MDMISDIVEREDTGPAEPPSAPTAKAPGAPKMSAWRARQATRKTQATQGTGAGLAESKIARALSKAKGDTTTDSSKPIDTQFSESERIHIENLERLSKMTEAEIEREREEILGHMDVNVLRGLLRRAEMRDAGEDNDFDGIMDPNAVDQALTGNPVRQPVVNSNKEAAEALEAKNVPPPLGSAGIPKKDLSTFSIADVGVEGLVPGDERYPSFEDLQRVEAELDEAERSKMEVSNVHFPRDPTQVADDLDESDPLFFDKLHAKYFPSLPAEPEKLAWMQPAAERSGDDTTQGLLPSELRFDFKGNLISPRVSEQLPSHLGLHHHGDAPSEAGYTVLELAHLARSSAPSQRCMAIQTLGRVLYRLGRNELGAEIGAGVWGLVDQARVMDSLHEASDEKLTKNMSVRAYAVEALWLWQKSGGFRPAV